MWVSRRHYETLCANVEKARQHVCDLSNELFRVRTDSARHSWVQLQRAQSKLEAQAARIGSLEAFVSWLTAHSTRLDYERTKLLARLQVDVPVQELSYEPPAEAPAPAVGGKVMPLDATGELGALDTDSVEAARHLGVSFDDMGDTAADAQGIGHNPDGSVRYSR